MVQIFEIQRSTGFTQEKNIDKLVKSNFNKENKGLTDYLVDNLLRVRDVVTPLLVHNHTIDVIYSGRIPPNPADLLLSNRVEELMTEARSHYDYIIVDTAPLMVVSDTRLITDHADQIIYVTRAGFTETKVLDFPLKLHKDGSLKRLAFIVNDVKTSNLGYGGRYGYGYSSSSKRKWWQAS